MHFEVVFLLKGKEVARYRFSAEAPVDFQAGVGNAIETLRVDHPEVGLLWRWRPCAGQKGWTMISKQLV